MLPPTFDWDGFVSEHRRLLLFVAHQAGALPADVEDITQECLLRVYLHRAQMDDAVMARNYGCRCARNLAVDYYRRACTARRRDAWLRPADEPLPLARVCDDEAVGVIAEAVGHLSDEQQAVMRLRLDGLANTAIAGRLDIPRVTVGTRLLRGRVRLRGLLDLEAVA